jgi:hypothetical protein
MAIDLTLLDKYSSITSVSGYKTLTLAKWNNIIIIRGLHTKLYAELLELKKNYPVTITEQQEILRQHTTYEIAETPQTRTEEMARINGKLKRLIDKYACTLKEIDIRDRNLIVRVV